jgi:hypothetical protein
MSSAEDQLLSTASVRRRYDGVSDMWIWRRLADDPTFPRPLYIRRRRYWSLNALIVWERDLAVRPHSPRKAVEAQAAANPMTHVAFAKVRGEPTRELVPVGSSHTTRNPKL